MMSNIRAGWVALIVLLVATALMVFFVWPRISGDGTETAGETAAPASPAATPEAPKPATPEPATTEAAPAAPAPAEPAKTETAPDAAATTPAPAPAAETAAALPVPSFDVLRVEPDGSTVIAGRTLPSSRLEILDGDTAIASSDVDASGDFAVVLEQPLAPGDHALTLKATARDGKSVVSEEVATVSVPKDGKGELLAMVTKPGAASRIITAPAAAAPAETAAAKTDKPAAASPAPAETAAATPEATPAPAAPAAPSAPAVSADLRVTAVEIEGDRIYIAGVARPGTTVRAYADDALVGEATADARGNFVADGRQALSVGSHRIRVDAVDAAGKVVLRAEVPFDRPDGEQVAVVASDAAAAAPTDLAPLGDGRFDKLREEARKAFGLLSALFDGGKVPAADALAAARSSTEIALKSLSEFHLPAGADAAATAIVDRTAAAAGQALALLRSYPADGKDLAAGLKDLDALIRQALAPSSGGSATPAPDAPATAETTAPAESAAPATAETAAPAAPPAAPAEAAGTAEAPATITQAPLKPSATSVIIRRGDTLWQISRRVYGQGVRYTTIYLANQAEIRNPDLIEPGQIFSVPEKALPNAEELHRQRLQKQKGN